MRGEPQIDAVMKRTRKRMAVAVAVLCCAAAVLAVSVAAFLLSSEATRAPPELAGASPEKVRPADEPPPPVTPSRPFEPPGDMPPVDMSLGEGRGTCVGTALECGVVPALPGLTPPLEPSETEDRTGVGNPAPPVAVAVLDPLPPLVSPGSGTGALPTAMPPPLSVETVPVVVEPYTFERFPLLDAPGEAVAGKEVTVSVALTEEQLTPDITVKPPAGAKPAQPGALILGLPAEADEWPIDIDLVAPGFDLAGGGAWSRGVVLQREGDSDVARFTLKARPVAGTLARKLGARFYHKGKFLGSASRPITVRSDEIVPTLVAPQTPSAAAPAGEIKFSSEFSIGDDRNVPDLDVTVVYDDPEHLGHGLMMIHSPHIAGPVTAEFDTPPAMAGWLASEFDRLVALGRQVRSVQSLREASPTDPEAQRRFVTRAAEGLGDDLYRRYVPPAFKSEFWTLRRQGKLHSIQITSNSPAFPWELVRPVSEEGESAGFLGLGFRLARWAPREAAAQLDRPMDRMVFTGVAAVAPAYSGRQALPFQREEIEMLSRLAGYRSFDGSFRAFEQMINETATGFIHFSGHGSVNAPGGGAPVFAIELADQSLDPTTWRALRFPSYENGSPFYFFNACDSGDAESLGGFVQGWGPAILATGASGFIGGMWPLTDRTAAAFSASFYGELAQQMPAGPVYLAEVLQDVRRKFYETGDPTYLAYTFYGNVNLQVTAAR